ncbi:HAD family hydrolase [Amycolatopsis sp. K13G38]|uniref:HAD family hydrolase n=1 Tax=Amycolatopsis acididurans TaxID=2724524 RepID=A0ABX1J5Y3_9PSEU|nr:haloacid dehalogenase-like hydrolase [Amycolatopsis acididurans]NKQ55191.1 HAD family hydrolase [Amycolatopsis acididurans]
MGMTVGFDLDMTLIDPRPGMTAVMNVLGEEAGLALDGEYFAAHLGPPLDQVLREFGAPEDRIPALVARFRELYPEIVIPSTIALPGAHAALEAVRRAGGQTLVVTGKFGPNAERHVKALGFEVDVLVGELWADGKAAALREHRALAYAGDHLGDIRGALAAGVTPIGVATGPCAREELTAAGAEVVFDSLEEFPGWLSASGVRASVR